MQMIIILIQLSRDLVCHTVRNATAYIATDEGQFEQPVAYSCLKVAGELVDANGAREPKMTRGYCTS